ncbi:DNA polymerase III subunit delta' [Paraglaciecola aestuariivivens]
MYPWFNELHLQLSQRLAKDKLHHALLFQGPIGLGKSALVQQFAEYILCANKQADKVCGQCQPCLLNAAKTHPDLHIVESEKQIGVDQIREAIKKLSGSAHMSGAKALIIEKAHKMTENSANALLKTLEEPTDQTYLLLTTDKPESILPTIKSRCEKLVLPKPNLSQTMAWVQSQFDGQVDKELASMFCHRPLALLAELQEQQDFSYQDFLEKIAKLQQGALSPLQLATSWQDNASKVLKWSQFWARQQCTVQANNSVWALHQQVVKGTQQLTNAGVNKILILTELLDKIVSIQPVINSN